LTLGPLAGDRVTVSLISVPTEEPDTTRPTLVLGFSSSDTMAIDVYSFTLQGVDVIATVAATTDASVTPPSMVSVEPVAIGAAWDVWVEATNPLFGLPAGSQAVVAVDVDAFLGDGSFAGSDSGTLTLSAVPEPAVGWLLAGGVLGGMARRVARLAGGSGGPARSHPPHEGAC
jgi:hypothetical protein